MKTRFRPPVKFVTLADLVEELPVSEEFFENLKAGG